MLQSEWKKGEVGTSWQVFKFEENMKSNSWKSKSGLRIPGKSPWSDREICTWNTNSQHLFSRETFSTAELEATSDSWVLKGYSTDQKCVKVLSSPSISSAPKAIRAFHKAVLCIRQSLRYILLQKAPNRAHVFGITPAQRAACSLTTSFPLTEKRWMTASWMLLLGAETVSRNCDPCVFFCPIKCVTKLNLAATQPILSLIFLQYKGTIHVRKV